MPSAASAETPVAALGPIEVARANTPPSLTITDDFSVTICESTVGSLVVQTDQLRRPCHIVWRNERRIGVVFD
jgi:hypothetical protein